MAMHAAWPRVAPAAQPCGHPAKRLAGNGIPEGAATKNGYGVGLFPFDKYDHLKIGVTLATAVRNGDETRESLMLRTVDLPPTITRTTAASPITVGPGEVLRVGAMVNRGLQTITFPPTIARADGLLEHDMNVNSAGIISAHRTELEEIQSEHTQQLVPQAQKDATFVAWGAAKVSAELLFRAFFLLIFF